MNRKMHYFSRRSRLFRLQPTYFFSNRKVKDRLFCYIFEHDRKALLQLYNALNHTDYRDEQALRIVTLDSVVYMSMQNDVAFLLIGTLNLYEHQSTLCPNLPLRFLLYIAMEYEALAAKMGANIYGKTLIPLPAPRCVVFYNGDDEAADEQFLRLSDAFTDGQGNQPASCLELTVRMVNINAGHSSRLMSGCKRLDEYSRFVDCIKQYRQKGFSTDWAVDNAVAYCIDHDIMADILLPFRAEVKKMLLTEYNERKYMRMFRKEAQEEGREEGRKEGLQEGREEGREEGLQEGLQKGQDILLCVMLQNGASVDQLSKWTGLPPKKIEKARKSQKPGKSNRKRVRKP